MKARALALTILLGLIAGLTGAWLGNRLFAPRIEQSTSLHTAVHHDLQLTASQDREVAALEAAFAARRAKLEADMRAANGELAAAIAEEGTYGPKVSAAIDHFHVAMGALQKATIEHVFAMRARLTPEQAKQFDGTVVKALTDERG